jgi:hypothetical protein
MFLDAGAELVSQKYLVIRKGSRRTYYVFVADRLFKYVIPKLRDVLRSSRGLR